MKQTIFILLLAIPLICLAQRQLVILYVYDASGNRILRKAGYQIPRDSVPELLSVSQDSIKTDPQTSNLDPQISNLEPQTTEYFVEKIAQTEIKIYPNPTNEKITLEFSGGGFSRGVETRLIASLRLYSLSGQLLQEQSVYSAITTVSLAGLAKGAYILKVNVNGVTEEWKIIKN